MLKELAKYVEVEVAAKALAGNWQNWRSFVWFGSDDYPDSQNIMLGYIVNNMESSAVDHANYITVRKALEPYLGMFEDETKTADNFGSSFWGQKDAFNGFMVRVYDSDGNITDAFKAIFELSQDYLDGEYLDEDDFKVAERKEYLRWVGSEIDWLAEQNDVKIKDDTERVSMVTTMVDCLIDEDERYDHDPDLEKTFKDIFCANTN